MAISTAVGLDRVSTVVGYEVQKGNFNETTPNLPMRIAVFGQANTASQPADNTPVEVFSAKEAGEKFGFGSQIHIMMRILRSRLGDVVGGIPTVIYPQLAPSGGTAQVNDLTVTGTATGNATHTLSIMGRSVFDGKSLEFTVLKDETPTQIAAKIRDAVNNAQSCPVSASAAAGVVTMTCKWTGESTTELNSGYAVSVNNNAVGVSYAVTEDSAGAGSSAGEIAESLTLFNEAWNTIVISPYPASRDSLFEDANGVPGESPATGRYLGITFKPFVCLRGTTEATSVASVTTGLQKDEGTIVQCPAPNSKGWEAEAAANYAVLMARQAQDTPHLDIQDMYLPDMPVPDDQSAGVFNDYNSRDAIIKAGSSTATIKNGRYQVKDFVTTYHPDNEEPPQFRYVRSLIQDWNVRYGILLLEDVNVLGHAIVSNDVVVSVSKTVKPKQWRQIMLSYFENLAKRALIVDVQFSAQSLQVSTGDTNPDRFETSFDYKRSPFGRIVSTTGTAGFAFNLQ